MPELLLELLSEEIPARMQARAAENLEYFLTTYLVQKALGPVSANIYATPRRLTYIADNVRQRRIGVPEEKKGPRVGAPEAAILGFLKANGLESLDACEIRQDKKKGDYYVAVIAEETQDTIEFLPDIIELAFEAVGWQKSMRWADHGARVRWVRPLHSILCVFGETVVPVTFGPFVAGGTTLGHRFLAPDPITVTNFADYEKKLRAAKVMIDPVERRAVIKKQAEKLAAAEGLTLKQDDGLLTEVTGLVEWPVVLMGRIDAAFMDLPPEVLITSMRHHQKYFSLLDKDGDLAPRFIVVSNMEATDGGKAIVAGNERVLRARLADAKFFWDQDRKTKLEDRLPQLEKVVFQARLGTLAEKVERMQSLAAHLAPHCGADEGDAVRAAQLCKADLVSEMVVEFTDLQGLMGKYYALDQGEKPEVAQAIADHYSPAGPNDDCPSAPVSVTVALADKIDSLVGFFAIDEKPTGSKDPFALRRTALGIIRLIVENGLRIGLTSVVNKAHALLEDHLDKGTVRVPLGPKIVTEGGSSFQLKQAHKIFSAEVVADDLLAFFADRLKVHLRGEGVRHDLIDAVFALGGEDDLVRIRKRVEALNSFLETDDGANLLTAYKRAANILRIEEKNDGRTYSGGADAAKLEQEEEKVLLAALGQAEAKCAPALQKEDFAAAMSALATLRGPVDAFFDHVTVNCDDKILRLNRLLLLSQIRAAMDRVADFSRIEGGER